VLRLVSTNVGDLVSTELLAELWNAYSLSHRQKLPTSTDNSANSSGFKSLLRPNRRAPKSDKLNKHHVVDVDMITPPKNENVLN